MSNKTKTTIIIPARYGSVRFPGKLLYDLEGKPVIQWVYEKAMESKADDVWIATDDEKIMNAVKAFGGRAVMTSPDHPSGTDRIWEAVEKVSSSGDDNEVIINLQGDEPLLPTEVIDQLIDMMQADSALEMSTVAVSALREDIAADPNRVKVVKSAGSDRALYFTRAAAPFLRDGGEECGMLLHWGIYAYRKSTLRTIVALPESSLEKCEKLEQLRALEAGISIHILITNKSTVGIDTSEDLELVRKILKNQQK
jgi:3-deoxy-manno-octulosonate cytidylyltransferase (CMP-KDO synthetase)